ncbi:MAG: hypothetical protein H6Q90_1774 [Deltaproteobacteria bacterium]|nr:hypothetical protein [Deltaproteobacteria bacterium]
MTAAYSASMRLALFCLLAGCSFDPSAAIGDAAAIEHDGCTSFSHQVDTCTLPPGTPLTLSGALTYDTTTGTLSSGGAPIAVTSLTLPTPAGEIEAIVATRVTLASDASLRAIGSRPFAIIATDTIVLATGGPASGALIDVSADGAGARSTCAGAALVGGDSDAGAGGGGGGGFGGPGGTGGIGNSDDTPSVGGMGGGPSPPSGVLGGCAGARGGNDDHDDGGSGGAGGGAVYLVSAIRIDIETGAGIQAGGGAGAGGRQHGLFFGDAGGGGGGSGGMILLEAPVVATTGTLAANGGGGGEGSGSISPGNPGSPGLFATTRANGGNGRSSAGGDGGSGGALDRSGQSVTPATGGAGGGGGGAGVIEVVSGAPSLNALISPPPT